MGSNYAAVADVNGDGKLDIITGGFSVLLGKGDGTFTVGTSSRLDAWNAPVQIADVKGDGKLDIITEDTNSQNVQSLDILLGNDDGTFQTPITIAAPANDFVTFGVADFNGDGLLDFAISGTYQGTVLLQTPPQ